MANPYRDAKGHWTTKENDGGPCQHSDNRHQVRVNKGKYQVRLDKDKDWEDVDTEEEFKELRETAADYEDDETIDDDFGFDEDDEFEEILKAMKEDGVDLENPHEVAEYLGADLGLDWEDQFSFMERMGYSVDDIESVRNPEDDISDEDGESDNTVYHFETSDNGEEPENLTLDDIATMVDRNMEGEMTRENVDNFLKGAGLIDEEQRKEVLDRLGLDDKEQETDIYNEREKAETDNPKYKEYTEKGKTTWNQPLKKGQKVIIKGKDGEDVEAYIDGFWYQSNLQEEDTYDKLKNSTFADWRGIQLVDESGKVIGSINANQIKKVASESGDDEWLDKNSLKDFKFFGAPVITDDTGTHQEYEKGMGQRKHTKVYKAKDLLDALKQLKKDYPNGFGIKSHTGPDGEKTYGQYDEDWKNMDELIKELEEQLNKGKK